MKRIISSLAFCVLLLQPSLIFAVDTTVFGLKIGEPLSLPECTRREGSTSQRIYYDYSSDNTCWKYGAGGDNGLDDAMLMVRYPSKKRPAISDGTDIYLLVLDKKIERVSFRTSGAAVQTDILETLKTKYGEPSKIDFIKKGNAYGASVDSIVALWSFPELTVKFTGVVDSLDVGYINITSSKMQNRIETQLKENAKKRPEL